MMFEEARIAEELNLVFEGAKNRQPQQDSASPHGLQERSDTARLGSALRLKLN
jgi:hypothetical protein